MRKRRCEVEEKRKKSKTNLLCSPLCLFLLEDYRGPDAARYDPTGPRLFVVPVGIVRLVVVAVLRL